MTGDAPLNRPKQTLTKILAAWTEKIKHSAAKSDEYAFESRSYKRAGQAVSANVSKR